MAYIVCCMLAGGAFSTVALPGCLAAGTTLPLTGNSRGWSFQFAERHHHVAGQAAAAIVLFSETPVALVN